MVQNVKPTDNEFVTECETLQKLSETQLADKLSAEWEKNVNECRNSFESKEAYLAVRNQEVKQGTRLI